MSLSGRVALVTGASQGIGRACALKLASAGATVAVAARNQEKLDELVNEISGAGGKAAAFAVDVSDEEQIKSAVKAAIAQFGKVGQAEQAIYAASRAGLIGFTMAIAREVGSRNIPCNAVSRVFIETAMTATLGDEFKQTAAKQIPLGRVGAPEDVASAVAFLSSDEASYITGHVLNVNGGLLMG